jgi:hypothetical protein
LEIILKKNQIFHAGMTWVLLVLNSQSFAQISPLTDKDIVVAEVSRTVSVGWSKNTWTNFQSGEATYRRLPNDLQVLDGDVTKFVVSTKTFFSHSQGMRSVPALAVQTSTRDDKSLEVGLTWKADNTFPMLPVSWCATNGYKFDSKFEVEAAESFTLKMADKDVVLSVLPVVEKGWWNRCYSGRRLVRMLYSKEIDAVVSIEFLSYTPQGQVDPASYRVNFKEIKRSN